MSKVRATMQKRLTNVVVVRVKAHEKWWNTPKYFEIACYKNKVLPWRSGVQKDLDEVLVSHIVYSNVSKGVLVSSRDLISEFGTDDHSAVCLEILKKGELQVSEEERNSQLSSQFRDIATIVMQKTFNSETQFPYTLDMIEHLMHEVHFSVDPHSSAKKQALGVIHELQKHFPIKRSPMRLRLTVPENNFPFLMEKLKARNASIVSKDEPGLVCEIEPSFFRCCDALVRNLWGSLKVLAVSVHAEGDTHVDHSDDLKENPSNLSKESTDYVPLPSERIREQVILTGNTIAERDVKQNMCSTCDAVVGDAKQYWEHFKSDWHKHDLRRKTKQLPPLSAEEYMADMDVGDAKQYWEHFKSDWHKHDLRRKTKQLPPLSAEEYMADMDVGDVKADLKDYSF